MSVASHSSNKLFQKVTLIKIIVITHHIPTQLCTAAEFQNSTINGAFTIELGTFIAIKSRAFATSIWSFYGYMKLNITKTMFFPIDNITLLPLRGGVCGHSQTPRISSIHRTLYTVGHFISQTLLLPRALPMADRLSPFQGVTGRCALKGQPSGSPMQRIGKTTSPKHRIGIYGIPEFERTGQNGKTNIRPTVPKGHKHQEYGTIAL